MPRPLHHSFLDTYNLSTSSLGCQTLCIILSFFVLASICFSLVHFKNGPAYLTRGTAKVFTAFIRLRQYFFVSSSFLILLRHSFFSLITTCLITLDSNIPNTHVAKPFIGTHFNWPCSSVDRSVRVCPGSGGSRSRCALPGILEPQGRPSRF